MSIARPTADMTGPTVYRKFKLPLDESRLIDPKALAELWSAARQAAAITGVALSEPLRPERTRNRNVILSDTNEFDLYKNSFILRKRIALRHDQSVRQETILKFRHPDRWTALHVDPRPAAEIPHILRFKEQVLPSKSDEHGLRSIFWHGCKIFEPFNPEDVPFGALATLFPALRHLGVDPDARLKAVNGAIVDERLSEIGKLEFVERVAARVLVSLWTVQPRQTALTSDLSFQIKYDPRKINSERLRGQSESFYLELQSRLAGWTKPGGTKVREIYHLYTGRAERTRSYKTGGGRREVAQRGSGDDARVRPDAIHPAA